MRDFDWLLRRIQLGLGAAAPLVAPSAIDARPPVPIRAEAEPPFRLPPCPSGDWCAAAPDARALAEKKGAFKFGCPVAVDSTKAPTTGKGAERYPFPKGSHVTLALDEAATKTRQAKGDKDACCYHWYQRCPGGRPLLDAQSHEIVASVKPGTAWNETWDEAKAELPAGVTSQLAAAWLGDGLAEHAAIASFARATLELMAVGAPPDLVSRTQAASLDEVTHARLCFGLAARYGSSVSPGPLPALAPRDGGLVRVAVDTFAEGCVGETIASLCCVRALERATDPVVRSALAVIAEDEASHAALAWATVGWAVREGGPPVLAALAEACRDLRTVRTAIAAPSTEPRSTSTWLMAEHGRLDAAALRTTASDAWDRIISPAYAFICHADTPAQVQARA